MSSAHAKPTTKAQKLLTQETAGRGRENILRFSPAVKSVTFSAEIIETSIGGTHTIGVITADANSSPAINIGASNYSQLNSDEKETLNTPLKTIDLNVKVINSLGDSVQKSLTATFNIDSPVVSRDSDMKNVFSYATPKKNGRRNTVDARENNLDVGGLDSPLRRHTLESIVSATPDCYNTVQMETPIHPDLSYSCGDKLVSPGEDSCSLTVAVRIRPYSQRELADPNARCVVEMSNNETRVLTDAGHLHNFSYDFSFWSFDQDHGFFAGQEKVYKLLAQPLLSKAFEGYNTCLFAYGQTGSGKSYCIMGHGSQVGIIPRYCEELFDRAQFITRRENVRMNMEISFFEIYNEKIHDLLASSKEKGGKKETLKVREHPVLGPYVEGLSTYVVNSFDDVEGWIGLGNKNRATAATGMNDKSSRSHSVFTLVLTQTRNEIIDGKDDQHCITSKINLVDLAGSERQSQAKTTGERFREGANINKSLLTLGKVISVLSERSTCSNKKKRIFIPYRDSVLTWLLRESLGGNSKTAMLATISPSNDHIEETLSTLRYAQQARSIVNVVRVNEDPKARIIRELRSEIGRLRSVLGMSADVTQAAHLVENMTLKDQLRAKEREMETITRSWQERLRLAEERKQEEAEVLKRSGVTFKVDNGLPYFVNLNEDSQLSEMLLYVIKDGQTRVGRMKDGSKNDIQLHGGLIADSHCIINNMDGIVSITPIADAPTYVNGQLVTAPTIIQHGDRVVLGGNHFFRLNHRLQDGDSNSAGEVKDFEFARQELLEVQEAKLQKELEVVRKQTEREMQERVETARKEAEDELRQQRTGYEGRLAEMEKDLNAQSLAAQEVAPLQQEVEDLTEKLKKQKKTMEQEIQNGKLRQEVEAGEKVTIPVSSEKSRLLELLESEREKAIHRLEHLRQRRNDMMNLLHRPSLPEAASNTSKTSLFRITLLVREANKISQYLRKHLSFSQDTLINNNLAKKMIRVTNTKLNICTHWSLEKFENRLCQMRDLFENESDSSTDDEVFSDPSDTWDKEDRFCSPQMSPGVLSGYRRYSHSPGNSLRQSMTSSMSSMGRRGSLRQSDSESSSSCSNTTGTPLVSLCKNLVQDTLERFQEPNREHTIADKILHSCEFLKQSILSITDRSNEVSSSDAAGATSIHLSHGLQQVMCYANCWSMMYDHLDSTHISDLVRRLRDKVKAIGNCTGYFLQGCENGIEGLIQETGNNLQDSVLVVCKICGELALSTDTAVTSLDEGNDEDGKLGPDICQAFLSGCDEFIDKALQGGLKTLEEFETKAQDYVDRTAPSLILGEVPKHVEIVVATTKILLLKCQEIQVEVDSSLRESMDNKPVQYYGVCFSRLQALITHISELVDGVTLLMQATNKIAEGEDKDIGKVCRCVEIIQKAADRLLVSSNRDSVKIVQCVSDTDISETSVLSDSQMELLDYAVQEVKLATSTLNHHAQRVLDTSDSNSTMSPTRIKRILPVSPDQSSVTPKFTYPRRAAPRNINLMKNGNS